MDKESEIASIRARLAELDKARALLTKRLQDIRASSADAGLRADNISDVTTTSKAGDKIALFRRLFAGRQDISLCAAKSS